MSNSWKKDIWRPIFGTVMLQPFMLLWAYYTDVSYLTNLAPLTILTTIILIPIYRWYEKIANADRFNEPKWI